MIAKIIASALMFLAMYLHASASERAPSTAGASLARAENR